MAWDADSRGWPIDPSRVAPVPAAAAAAADSVRAIRSEADGEGHTVESYVWDVWWPTLAPTLDDKNRIGHRRNAEVAVQLVRYSANDRRLDTAHLAGGSVAHHLVSDDLRAAVVARRTINGRTAAVNKRRVEAASTSRGEAVEIELLPEIASATTVRAFTVTLGMIIKAAAVSNHVSGDPMTGVMALAPKHRTGRLSQRFVPTVDEVFDLADAISTLGPTMADGRPAGERFRSLILAAGTLGPRPGELVAHQPEWLTAAGPSLVRFQATEAAVYDTPAGSPGRRERQLKHRELGDYRDVPVIPEVADAIATHLDRGYGSVDRTWLSSTGRGHLDWGNILKTYWRPALVAVFSGGAKESLTHATPKILRKAAITWWLERGVSPTVAAEWAGHTEEVMQIYYASRSTATWQTEADMLVRRRDT